MYKSSQVKKRSVYPASDLLSPKKSIILFVIVGFIVFFNMLYNGIVWDDITFIFLNPNIRSFNLFQLFGANVFNSGGYYRPIAAIYFSLLYGLFGQQAFYYHLIQLLLHITSTVLLFYFFRTFFRVNLSFVLAVIFLIHPIQVESVSYIGATQSELLFLFGMGALLLTMRKNVTIITFSASFLSLLLALLTKETSFLFIFMILLYQLLFSRKNIRVFMFAVVFDVFLYFIIRLQIAHILFQENLTTPISRLNLFWRILNIPEIFFYYLKTFFYPASLSIDQRWAVNTVDFTYFYLPFMIDSIFFLLVAVLGFCCKRKNQNIFLSFIFFFSWFFLGMGLLMQLYPLDMTVSDRWFYFPFVGLLGMIGLSFTLFHTYLFKHKIAAMILLFVVFILLSARTVVRNLNWSDSITLYSHDSHIDPMNTELVSMLGSSLAINGQYQKALPYLLKIDQQHPDKITLSNTAMTYEKMGDFTKAVYYYKKALLVTNDYRGSSSDMMININLGVVYLNHFSSSYAISYAKRLIQKYPNNGELWLILSVAEYRSGMINIALNDLHVAYSLDPSISYEYYANNMLQRLPVQIN